MTYRLQIFKYQEHLVIDKENLTDEVTSLALNEKFWKLELSYLNSPPNDDDDDDMATYKDNK